MVVTQETILSIVKQRGPLLPAQLAKEIGTDIIIASAHLSNLVDRNVVKISNTKVGGSPVYYTQGQEEKLQDYADNLNEKDQKNLILLKEKKILRDDKLDNLARVSMRVIKDFAIPLQVTKGKEKILFWKWYLVSNKDVEGSIREQLNMKSNEEKRKEVEAAKREESKRFEEAKKLDEAKQVEEKRKLDEIKKKEELIRENESKRLQEEKIKVEEEKKKLEQKRIEGEMLLDKRKIEETNAIIEERKGLEQERLQMQKQMALERANLQKQMEQERQTILKEIEEKSKPKVKTEKKIEEDTFLQYVISYFNESKIQLVEHKVLRKKADIEMILKIPSVVGDLEYFCRAKNKKTVSDSDLSSAVVQGQLKRMPVLFLTTGELSKKAKELLESELRRGLVIKKI